MWGYHPYSLMRWKCYVFKDWDRLDLPHWCSYSSSKHPTMSKKIPTMSKKKYLPCPPFGQRRFVLCIISLTCGAQKWHYALWRWFILLYKKNSLKSYKQTHCHFQSLLRKKNAARRIWCLFYVDSFTFVVWLGKLMRRENLRIWFVILLLSLLDACGSNLQVTFHLICLLAN